MKKQAKNGEKHTKWIFLTVFGKCTYLGATITLKRGLQQALTALSRTHHVRRVQRIEGESLFA